MHRGYCLFLKKQEKYFYITVVAYPQIFVWGVKGIILFGFLEVYIYRFFYYCVLFCCVELSKFYSFHWYHQKIDAFLSYRDVGQQLKLCNMMTTNIRPHSQISNQTHKYTTHVNTQQSSCHCILTFDVPSRFSPWFLLSRPGWNPGDSATCWASDFTFRSADGLNSILISVTVDSTE